MDLRVKSYRILLLFCHLSCLTIEAMTAFNDALGLGLQWDGHRAERNWPPFLNEPSLLLHTPWEFFKAFWRWARIEKSYATGTVHFARSLDRPQDSLLSAQFLCIITAASLHHHCIITASSLHHHCSTTASPLHHHCIITASSRSVLSQGT
jgi:hypothetical protein